MAEQKYAKYIIKGVPPRLLEGAGRPRPGGATPTLHHILSVNHNIIEGAITMNCSWLLAGEDPGVMAAHTHPYPEIIIFAGTNPNDVSDLGAEAELWMEDEKYIVNNSFIIYVPKGLRHCPLILRNLKTPVFHFDLQLTTSDFKAVPVAAPSEAKITELKYEKYIIKGGLPSFAAGARSGKFDSKVTRPKLHPVMALTKHAVEGAVIVICSWMWAGENPGVQGAHTHPYDEIIGFAGTNPNDLHDLGAEAELWMEDEKYIINNSFFVYVPKGVKHCPLIIRDIKRPVLHFDIQLTTGEFSEAAA